MHGSNFCAREAPSGGCTGLKWQARQRATERSAVRAARSQCSGGGKTGGAGQPAFRDVGRTPQGS
ncbi:hypothetical protein [Xenorhabdus mauleonii]|uniref:hypothetical protein n=1 Tax=Xenorhabdus mauleonii TaxID=351675 RepID=UPI000B83BA9D|nr:hypothetical protein [Xenorhabdus mauleonii]